MRLTLDVISLCACLTVTITDDNKYKVVVDQRGVGAQSLINLLQAVCSRGDWPVCIIDVNQFYQRLDFTISSAQRRCHFEALIKLSQASGLYPECLTLGDIEMGEHPVVQGSYGDVHKGLLEGAADRCGRSLKFCEGEDITRRLNVNFASNFTHP